MSTLLLFHFAVTWALTGLIWTIQLVHYPLFADVGAENFRDYHRRHTTLIAWLVGPLMLAELVTAVALVRDGNRDPWFLGSLLPLASNWLSTWRVQIPLHDKLSTGFDRPAHHRLVRSNWWRTAAWTLRAGCLLVMMNR
jgi:hypothetical protein